MNAGTESESAAPFVSAHATGASWQNAVGEVIRQLGVLDQSYRLGIVYVTPPFARYLQELEVLLRQTTGVPHWVGTVGYGVIATGVETVEEPAIAAMGLPLPEDSFRVFEGVSDETDAVSRTHEDWLRAAPSPLPEAARRHGRVPRVPRAWRPPAVRGSDPGVDPPPGHAGSSHTDRSQRHLPLPVRPRRLPGAKALLSGGTCPQILEGLQGAIPANTAETGPRRAA